eukprot:CAMPEP_0205946342 /NCGR_PEP_ID=MMETSP1325-20131115/68987_1 /ASSEMBLY_ACC=CAM_ASM_000708 /TAXON_ID=236786 /ORGANISM="Florenciella sp., Strain RCC1007" /LENGTH=124 /DNA_ID=CAMNT_0053317405 /DNA_START=42 /DNA_END=412 /DNA_ORIENTATION=-
MTSFFADRRTHDRRNRFGKGKRRHIVEAFRPVFLSQAPRLRGDVRQRRHDDDVCLSRRINGNHGHARIRQEAICPLPELPRSSAAIGIHRQHTFDDTAVPCSDCSPTVEVNVQAVDVVPSLTVA